MTDMFRPLTLDVIGLDNGQSVAEEIEKAMMQAVRDVRDPKRKGNGTINVSFTVIGDPDGGTSIRIVHDVKYTAPTMKRKGTIAFLDERAGKLVTQEGMQPDLPLAPVHDLNENR